MCIRDSVKIILEPNESGKGYEFVNAVVGGSIPKEFIPAVDAGIRGALQAGVVAGFPVVDVKVTLYDGSYHEVDSSETVSYTQLSPRRSSSGRRTAM